MRRGAKCTNLGSLGHLGVTQGHWQCHHSIERIRLLIRLYVDVLYRFRDIASYLSKVADFKPPHLHLVPPVELRGDLWHEKTRVPLYTCGVVCVILSLAMLTQYQLLTDGRTD